MHSSSEGMNQLCHSSSFMRCRNNTFNSVFHLQENIFGEDQTFTDMNQTHVEEDHLAGETAGAPEETKSDDSLNEQKKPEFDCRRYRQFAVTVYIDIRNVVGHLVKVSVGLVLLRLIVEKSLCVLYVLIFHCYLVGLDLN